jgi:hypothetical protein
MNKNVWGCECGTRKNWYVARRNSRCSAFDGYRVKWSPYSTVICPACSRAWRTKAAYVSTLPSKRLDDERK